MNIHTFQDICQGEYGRKIAYTRVREITDKNVVRVLAEGVSVLNENRPKIKYLHNYYKGDQPVLYRQKTIRDDCNRPVVENHALEWVNFKNAQSYGEPIQCVSLRNDEAINASVDRYNDYCRNASKTVSDIRCGMWQSSVGAGYKAVQRADGNAETPIRFVAPTPLNTIIVYNEDTEQPMLAIQCLKDENNEIYYLAFTDKVQYRIKNSKIVSSKPHAFGGIPIVEYPNNADRLSDIEVIITILDAVNEVQSNRSDSIEQFVQSFFKFINCDIDKEKYEAMKAMGAIVVNSANGDGKADVDIISQELNQGSVQTYKDDLLDAGEKILAIPGRNTGSDGGSTMGAVALRGGWDFAKQSANLKDAFIIESEKRINRVALNLIRQATNGQECNFSALDYDVHIVHSPTDNLFVKAESLELLLRSGVHPLVAIKACSLWSDPEKVYTQSKPYLDALYQTIDEKIASENLQGELDRAKAILEANKVGDTDGSKTV